MCLLGEEVDTELQICFSSSHVCSFVSLYHSRWIQRLICGLKEIRFAAVLPHQPHHQGNMAFAGKYEFEGDENYDEFVKKIGLPSDKIEMGRNCKIVTEVVQNGNDFTWTQHFPGGRTTTNSFTIGKEADMETMGGKKFKATVKMEDGKIVADFPNYRHTAEIAGGKLVEISTSSGVVYKRTSRRIA
ncbi:gastrotropin isoform X2 [Apus apus]|uniref:gastrotropin isoform X2 n=1 Tax=Apus apus TaxID=8895 RepID=UPI0021F8E338|nr:gastrotropin isoform X2 [Apus apus]